MKLEIDTTNNQKKRINKMRTIILVCYVIILHSCNLNREARSTWLTLEAERFYDYHDTVVFNKFTSISYHVMNKCKTHDTFNLEEIEVIAFSWSGYAGLEDFVKISFTEEMTVSICAMDSTLNSKAICHEQINKFFEAIHSTDKEVFIISDGYSFGFYQYIVVRHKGSVVFAQVSYGPSIYSFNKPRTILDQILKQYSRSTL